MTSISANVHTHMSINSKVFQSYNSTYRSRRRLRRRWRRRQRLCRGFRRRRRLCRGFRRRCRLRRTRDRRRRRRPRPSAAGGPKASRPYPATGARTTTVLRRRPKRDSGTALSSRGRRSAPVWR